MPELEIIGVNEPKQIENIIALSGKQLRKLYPAGGSSALRGQHAKDHACVSATFKILDDLPAHLRVGVFAVAAQEYPAWIRFSNAAAAKGPDSTLTGGAVVHGSRGMAMKVVGVQGASLSQQTDELLAQDFLMVNHPVFPFANVEDYEALTVVLDKTGIPDGFFLRMKPTENPDPEVNARAARTFEIVQRIKSASATIATPPGKWLAYEDPPASPVDSRYFGGAPFLFGEESVMRFSAVPRSAIAGDPATMTDEHYLRKALYERLIAPNAAAIVFDFKVQVRTATELAGKIPIVIENASEDWDVANFPWETIATITILPQDFDTPERRALCESLVFTPWNGLSEHRPLGGINRLRRAVYAASATHRSAREAHA